MTIDFINELDFKELFYKLMKQSLEEALSSASVELGGNPFIPMSFVDSNCITILKACQSPQTFESAGELCVHANKVANYKYGENKAKLMEQIGLLSINSMTSPHEITITKLGEQLLALDTTLSISLMIRLQVHIPVIAKLMSEPVGNPIDVASVFSDAYSNSTIKRRSSSIIHIIRDLEYEYRTTGYSHRITVGERISVNDEEEDLHNDDDISGPDEEDNEVLQTPQIISEELSEHKKQLTNDISTSEFETEYQSDLDENVKTVSDPPDSKDLIDLELCRYHPLLAKIKSFVNQFYKIKTESKISSMFESLINVIEDPSSEFITQTLAYLPLGYLVKYGNLTEQSVRETECACFMSLLKIYETNMDLLIYNLSPSFSLNDFYNLRETYVVKYGTVLQDVKKRLCIDEFFDRAGKEATSEKYSSELEQLYTSEANLYYRLVTEGTEMLDEDSFMRSMQIISQSRLEYPINGIDAKYVPLLKNNDAEEHQINSIKDCVLSELRLKILFDDIPQIWDFNYEDWHDTINELLLLAYILSPHRVIQNDDSDMIYAVCQAIADKSNYFDNEETQSEIDRIYESFISKTPEELQIKILNRVNSILIYSYLNTDFIPLVTNLQDDIICVTKICYNIDNKSGRKAKYKSRLGIVSSLDVFEKSDVKQIREHRNHTDSERSRQNRYVNKMRYDYDDE